MNKISELAHNFERESKKQAESTTRIVTEEFSNLEGFIQGESKKSAREIKIAMEELEILISTEVKKSSSKARGAMEELERVISTEAEVSVSKAKSAMEELEQISLSLVGQYQRFRIVLWLASLIIAFLTGMVVQTNLTVQPQDTTIPNVIDVDEFWKRN